MFTAAALAVTALIGATESSVAQYFGRNQVQYKSFDFKVLQTEHFDLYYYAEEQEAAEKAGIMAERWYSRLSRLLNHRLRGRQVVIYYASHPDFEQTNAIGGTPGEATGGVTEVFKRRVVLPFAGPLKETDHVLGHEIVHAFQFDMTGQGRTLSETTAPAALRLPLWFIEGMAEYLSVGPHDTHTSMWIRDALANDRLPSINQLYDPRYFPYRFGQAFWAYIAGRWGDDVIGRILNAAARTGSAENALQLVLRIPVDSLVTEWHDAIKFSYESLAEGAVPASEYGHRVLSDANAGKLNTSPVLSPDGQQVMFLSEKDLFSIEMFRADVESGRVQEKIVQTTTDSHYQSLQFINSAGAWSRAGSEFVFGSVINGNPALTIVDARNGQKLRDIPIRDIGEIVNPTWSPDGRYIAFSAIVGGLSDLYLYDLDLDALIQLTDDPYADLQPAWAPDGSRIAFVTDRFSTDLSALSFGNYRLATINPDNGEVLALPSFPRVKNINPQWSPDTQNLYFLSDRGGITNVYRLGLGSGEVFQVTNLYTGVTGITGLSPALSSAADTNRIAFSVYENGEYNVYSVSEAEALQGTRIAAEVVQDNTSIVLAEEDDDAEVALAGMLPPANRDQGEIERYLADPNYGLTDENGFGSSDYKPALSLDFISRPFLTAGTDRFGLFIGGGASAFWSDMLGRHNVATQLQIQGSLKDVAAIVGYTNRRHRLNWGLVVGQIPYISGRFSYGQFVTELGERVLIEQRDLRRQYNREVTGMVSYPFSRVHRLEFSLGGRNISFSRELRTIQTSLDTGQELADDKVDIPTFDALNLVQGSIALVYDNSFFGATGPILGQRYRLELGPSAGSLNYVSLLGDYRKYIMPLRPFTLAFRLTHFGRYGAGGEDAVLSDLFIGYPTLVRGYDFNSFSLQECDQGFNCPVLESLFGSKLVVGNAELRFPLFGALGIGQGMFGVLPVDFVAFGDAGLAWDSNVTGVRVLGLGCQIDCREPVYSAGVGLRINLLGFIIAEVDYVKPFQRLLKGAHWQFSFSPGF
jgi:Tol biopolymer transport system component